MAFTANCLNANRLFEYSTHLTILLLIWSLLWSTLGDEAVPPNGSLFNLLLLFFFSYIFGQIASIIHLPPFLGMLGIGFIFGNAFQLNLKHLSSILRPMVIVIILLRVGLGLDPKVYRKLSCVWLRLAFIPCIVEAITLSVITHLLIDFPLKWGFLLGFVLSGVSTIVIVSNMMALKQKQIGTDKGIPTLLMASASVNNVMAIVGFGICLQLVFNTKDSNVWYVFRGPVQALTGVVVGVIFGIILWFIPNESDSYHTRNELHIERLLLLLLFGMFTIFVSKSLDFGGAGPIGCLILAFIASLKWRAKGLDEPIRENLRILWIICEPFLFALIGAEVKISDLSTEAVKLAIIALFVGLIMRLITSMIVVFGAKFRLKEKLFISLAWIPKATLQAAIGPLALDLARDRNDPKLEETAKFVLVVAMLSILITAPLGAIAISLTANKCLNKAIDSTVCSGASNGLLTDELNDLENRPLLSELLVINSNQIKEH